MKKTILSIAVFAVIIILTAAFKNSYYEKKQYMSIYFNESLKFVTISGSDGTYQEVQYYKAKGVGDQTQLLSLINELEGKGYKILQYDHEVQGESQSVFSILMTK